MKSKQNINNWLDVVLQEDPESVDLVLDEIFFTIDDLICSGEFETVDFILEQASGEKFPKAINAVDQSIGILTVTYAARDRLENREKFRKKLKSGFEIFDKVDEERLNRLFDNPDDYLL